MNLSLPHYANAPCYQCGGKIVSRTWEGTTYTFCENCGSLIASRKATANSSDERPGNCSERTRSAPHAAVALAAYRLGQ